MKLKAFKKGAKICRPIEYIHLYPAPLKLRPYGAIQMCILLLLLLHAAVELKSVLSGNSFRTFTTATRLQTVVHLLLLLLFIIIMLSLPDSVVRLSVRRVRSCVSSSEQIFLPRCLMLGLSNLDETYAIHSLAHTDYLIRFWRSKVKDQRHSRPSRWRMHPRESPSSIDVAPFIIGVTLHCPP